MVLDSSPLWMLVNEQLVISLTVCRAEKKILPITVASKGPRLAQQAFYHMPEIDRAPFAF